MQRVQDCQPAEVGTFEFEVYGGGRLGRRTASRFKLRCDAIGLHEQEVLLLSVVGPETSVKALTAGLRSSGKDQRRIDYSVRVGELERSQLERCSAGYRIYRTRFAYGLWHVLCLAKRDGFMPVLTEESLWQQLQSDAFTTPLLRDWAAWLYRTMKERNLIVELDQSGCTAGLLLADNEALDQLVSEGVKAGHLAISGPAQARDHSKGGVGKEIQSLDDYMLAYGALLGKQAERSLNPLYVPGRDPLPSVELLREPFEAQAHALEAVRKALDRQKSLMLVGEMGTGKTLMGMAAVHAHSRGGPYRALVFCPGQLVRKWEREIRQTISDADVIQITSWKSLLRLDRGRRPTRVEWYILPRDRAKLGARWRPAYGRRSHAVEGFLRCPNCGLRLVTQEREPIGVGKPAGNGHSGTGLWKRRARCEWVLANSRGRHDPEREESDRLLEGCGAPLWQMTGELWRYEPALFIKRRLRHYFGYLILDEVHEEKGSATAQGNAAGALAASSHKVIALTGTLIGGYAEHLRPLLFRLAPRSLVQEGLGWSNATAFNERYGRLETRISERSALPGEDHRMSRGSKSTIKSVRPGIMPILFGKHLIDKTVFLGLSEVADNLPPLAEECFPVRMDAELAAAYQHQVEEPLSQAIKEMMKRRDRRLLGAMLQTLLAYPDYPFDWSPVGYWDTGEGGSGEFITITQPPSLPDRVIRAKEQALLDLVQTEKKKGRKVWVYVQFTDKHDVQARLERLLQEAGFQVAVLRSSVSLDRREQWIAEQAPRLDAVISHPRLVETGLDLFDGGGRYNFPTICFYETGYNLFTLRQAARRSWRIGQQQPCRIVYFYYDPTMQSRALALMGRKLTAAQALEGSFSSEGLVALAGEDANVEIDLARSLVEHMDEGDARRIWSKSFQPRPQAAEASHRLTAQRLLDLPIRKEDALPFRKPRQRLPALSAASDMPAGLSKRFLF